MINYKFVDTSEIVDSLDSQYHINASSTFRANMTPSQINNEKIRSQSRTQNRTQNRTPTQVSTANTARKLARNMQEELNKIEEQRLANYKSQNKITDKQLLAKRKI